MGKSSVFILLIIVAFLSLALAVMAGLFFFTSGKEKGPEVIVKTEEVPKDEELTRLEIEKKPFNLKQRDGSDTVDYIQISASIVYFIELEGIESPEAKINANTDAMKEIISKYFMSLTIDDIKKNDAIDKAKEELKKRLNEFLMKNEKVKGEIIYNVNFSEWLYQ